MKRLPIAILALACAFTGCKKDKEDNPAPTKTKAELLTAKNWRISADVVTIVSGGKTATSDEYASYTTCEKDDFTKYNTDKTLKEDQGTLKCDPSDPQQSSGTWDFNSDQTKLILSSPDFGGLAIPLELVELSATTLKLRLTQTQGSDSYSETITYTAF